MCWESMYDQLKAKFIFDAARLNDAGPSRINLGSLMREKKSPESASWKYVLRALMKATFLPPTVPRAKTIPCTVRYAFSVSDPFGVESTAFGVQLLVRSSSCIDRHWPLSRC